MELAPDVQPSEGARNLLVQAGDKHRAGDAAGSRALLKDAAETGDPTAVFSYASALASGYGGDRDRSVAFTLLTEIEQQSRAARRTIALAIATGWAVPADWAASVLRRADHALSGDAVAAMEVALICAAYRKPREAACWAKIGADEGEGFSTATLLRIAADAGRSIPDASSKLKFLRDVRHPSAADLSAGVDPKAPYLVLSAAPSIERLQEILSEAPSSVPSKERLSDDPASWVAPGAMPAALCDYIHARYHVLATPSRVYDRSTGQVVDHPVRKSFSAILDPVQSDLPLLLAEQQMAALGDSTVEFGEPLTVLFYGPGQEYKSHVDYFEPDDGAADEELARAGQRKRTVLVTLSDRFEGGATRFVAQGVEWKGSKGDALIFDNLNADGSVNQRSRHAGMPVASGEKALASLWLRERPNRSE